VMNGWDRYRGGVDASMQLFQMVERYAAKLPRRGLCPGRIRVHHRNQFYFFALLL